MQAENGTRPLQSKPLACEWLRHGLNVATDTWPTRSDPCRLARISATARSGWHTTRMQTRFHQMPVRDVPPHSLNLPQNLDPLYFHACMPQWQPHRTSVSSKYRQQQGQLRLLLRFFSFLCFLACQSAPARSPTASAGGVAVASSVLASVLRPTSAPAQTHCPLHSPREGSPKRA